MYFPGSSGIEKIGSEEWGCYYAYPKGFWGLCNGERLVEFGGPKLENARTTKSRVSQNNTGMFRDSWDDPRIVPRLWPGTKILIF